jgi:serine/threonine-protein phosphatase 2A regulatory subunit B'
MKTYNACKERAEEDAATRDQHEATTQAQWEQIYEIAEKVDT